MYQNVGHELQPLEDDDPLLKEDLQHAKNHNLRLQTQLEMQLQQPPVVAWRVKAWC